MSEKKDKLPPVVPYEDEGDYFPVLVGLLLGLIGILCLGLLCYVLVN